MQEAIDNICATWDQIMNQITDFEINIFSNLRIFSELSNDETQMIITLYSIECFLYKTLNEAIRFGDESKVDSLGPYA
jgi:hypothetical protein